MDLRQLEYAAEILFKICREHPEFCPHDYNWEGSTIDKTTGKSVKRFKCGLCGKSKELESFLYEH
jgi:hypothetical protein